MPKVVQLTPPGRGAIATVLVEGAGALGAVAALFRPVSDRPLPEYPADRPAFGHFGPEPGEEVVVRVRSAESVELHCHGGYAAMARITELLRRSGCSPLGWDDWARGHFEDPLTAEASVALAAARTQRTALILLDQFHGALRRAMDEIRQRLEQGNLTAAGQQIEMLLARATFGLHLVEPWRVVLAGPPNAGKSSLINSLVGYSRAIVHPAPGTTRDIVTATTAIEGWPVELSDTAGLREAQHPVEEAGVALAHETIAAADLVLLVFDGSQPWSDKDAALAAPRPGAVVVYNKSDLPPAPGPRLPGLWTSALRGDGIETLLETIAGRLVADPPSRGTAVLFTVAQVAALRAAQAALARNEPGTAATWVDW